eukprot:5120349-Pleurochrysis_carterae.AAC.1
MQNPLGREGSRRRKNSTYAGIHVKRKQWQQAATPRLVAFLCKACCVSGGRGRAGQPHPLPR